jgi:hypothetical protein
MVFANNVVYTDGGDALRFPQGAKGVIVSGNVVCGRVSGVLEGFILGSGLSHFTDVSWDGKKRDASLRPHSPAVGFADKRFPVALDIMNRKRSSRPTAGAFKAPWWSVFVSQNLNLTCGERRFLHSCFLIPR